MLLKFPFLKLATTKPEHSTIPKGGFMKSLQWLLSFAMALAVAVFMALSVSGCKKDSEGPAVQPITEDIFPLVVGRKITFSGMLRQDTTDVEITASAAVYVAKWTILTNSSPDPYGGAAATVINDSTQVPTGVANPPTVWRVNNLLIRRASPTGTSNIEFMNDLGLFYRTFGIAGTDTLKWMTIAKLDAGVGNEFEVFNQTFTGATGQVRLQVYGKFFAKEPLTVGGSTFNPYRLELGRRIYLGTSTTPATQGATATFWLEPGVGPVKMILNAGGAKGYFGHTRNFASKNF